MSGARDIPLRNTHLVPALLEPMCPDRAILSLLSIVLWRGRVIFCSVAALVPQLILPRAVLSNTNVCKFILFSTNRMPQPPTTSYSFIKCFIIHLFMLPSDHMSLFPLFLTLCQLQNHLTTPQPGWSYSNLRFPRLENFAQTYLQWLKPLITLKFQLSFLFLVELPMLIKGIFLKHIFCACYDAYSSGQNMLF